MVLAFLSFVCLILAVSGRLLRGGGGSGPGLSLEAEPETGILGKRRIEGVLSEETCQEQGKRDWAGEGAKEG